MKRKHKSKKESQLRLAREHISTLFNEAKSSYNKNKKTAHKQVKLARRIAMRFRIKLAKSYKRKFCKHCYHYLKPGDNCRIRTARGKVVIYCLDCKKYTRIGYKKN